MGKKYSRAKEAKVSQEAPEMHVVTVISQHKKRAHELKPGHKRVEALVRFGSSKRIFTRHIDIPR